MLFFCIIDTLTHINDKVNCVHISIIINSGLLIVKLFEKKKLYIWVFSNQKNTLAAVNF